MIKRRIPININCEEEKENKMDDTDDDTPLKKVSTSADNNNHLLRVTKAINFNAGGLGRENSSDSFILSQKGKKDFYFPVTDVKFNDLFDWKNYQNREPSDQSALKTGTAVTVNNKKIALFRMDKEVFAIDENCPHLGGPLHVGDIETIGEAHILCVICPWHKWRIDIKTGKVKIPQNRGKRSEVYPTVVLPDGTIQIGFSEISDKFFDMEQDF